MTHETHTYFSESITFDQIGKAHPALLSMIGWVSAWCYLKGIQCVFTSLYRPPNDGISESETHQEYRAIDLSMCPRRGWSRELMDEFEAQFTEIFHDVGALVWKGEELVSRPIYVHNPGPHGHLQVRRNL